MKTIKCQIVEDEPLAAELLADYVSQVSFLELNGISHSAMDASVLLREEPIDLLFLDLHLPGIKGFDFIRSMNNPPHIIVTTAYPQYALEGYELNVVDYLVKPIEFHRFFHAVNKLVGKPKTEESISGSPVYFRENRKNIRVWPDEIYYIEGQKDYVKIHLKDRQITTKITMHETQAMLPVKDFLRIHKSFLVALNKIEAFDLKSVSVLSNQLPIGRSYKDEVKNRLTV